MDKELKYYLSGPMTGYPSHNYPMFTEVTNHLRGLGFSIFTPHEEFMHESMEEHAKRPYAWYIARDIAHMAVHCNAIILLPGWVKSNGATIELRIALTLGFRVFYYLGGKQRKVIELA